MEWCSNCSMDVRSERENANGTICCSECGRVIHQDKLRDEPTIFKGAGGVDVVCGENAYQEDVKNSGRSSSTPESITAPATGKLRELSEEKVEGDEIAPAAVTDDESDIDDMEVVRYLNSKDVELYRKIASEELGFKLNHQDKPAPAPASAPASRISGKIHYEILHVLFNETLEK